MFLSSLVLADPPRTRHINRATTTTATNNKKTVPTGHVHHPAVAVLHDVARLAVDPAGRHAVHLEESRLQGPGLALSPRRRQVGQLQVRRGRGEESTDLKNASHIFSPLLAATLLKLMSRWTFHSFGQVEPTPDWGCGHQPERGMSALCDIIKDLFPRTVSFPSEKLPVVKQLGCYYVFWVTSREKIIPGRREQK